MTIRFARRMETVRTSTIRRDSQGHRATGDHLLRRRPSRARAFSLSTTPARHRARSQRAAQAALQYSPSEGYAPLREVFAAESRERRIACCADDILIMTGSQQPLDLTGKIFL